MQNHELAGLDTETGGLTARVNPLLSVGIVVVDANFDEVTSIHVKFRPPLGTVMEIPIREHQTLDVKGKSIERYADVYTGATVADVSQRPLVTAYAAEVNGYVPLLSGGIGWDLRFPPEWHRGALTYKEGEDRILEWLVQHYGAGQPTFVAHNAEFDKKFVAEYLPRVFARGNPDWYCTCDMLRKYHARTKHLRSPGEKGKADLGTLTKLAGFELPRDTVHDARDDARGCIAGLKWLGQQA